MCPEHNHSQHRIGVGIILIIIGILFFLRTTNVLEYNVFHVVFSWPFLFFAFGFIILINSKRIILGLFLTFAGILGLLPYFFPSVVIDSNIILAVFIIGLGLSIIFKKREFSFTNRNFQTEKTNSDLLDDISIFGGGMKTIFSDNFKGGKITAIFGGSKIDMRSCKLAEGNNVLDVITIFGGTTILVPNDWNVYIDVIPVFGGFSSKIRKDPSAPVDMTRKLTIKGIAIFGGGEIKSYH